MLKKMTKLSIIVAVYNIDKYLEACLNTLKNQTERSVEFLVIDDGSTDQSGEICDKYAEMDKRFRVYHLPQNQGSLNARIVGIKEAKGEWICFVDGDDRLGYSNAASDIIILADSYDKDILRFSTEARTLNDKTVEYWRGNFIGELEGSIRINRACFVNYQYSWEIWGKVYRESILKDLLPVITQEKISAAEDVYLYFLISTKAETFESVETKPIYLYTVGSGITSNNINSARFVKHFSREPIICNWLSTYIETLPNGNDYIPSLKQLSLHLTDNQINRLSLIDISEWPICIESLSRVVDAELIFKCLHRRMMLRRGRIEIDRSWIIDSLREENIKHYPFNQLMKRVSRIKIGFIRKRIMKLLKKLSR